MEERDGVGIVPRAFMSSNPRAKHCIPWYVVDISATPMPATVAVRLAKCVVLTPGESSLCDELSTFKQSDGVSMRQSSTAIIENPSAKNLQATFDDFATRRQPSDVDDSHRACDKGGGVPLP